MRLHIDTNDWAAAKDHFSKHPEEKKYTPNFDSPHFFIKTDTNLIFALARKKDRDLHILGRGAFSTVVTAQDETGTIYACKIIDPDYVLPDDHSIPVMKHLNVLKGQTIRRKNTPHVFMANRQETQIDNKGYIILEKAEGKPLVDILEDILNGESPPLNTLQKDMIALTCCLTLLNSHRQGVIHGDINLANVLIAMSRNDVCATLVDWGFSLLTNGKREVNIKPSRGTPDFAAPEIYSTQTYSEKSDIYALGTVFKNLNRTQWAKLFQADLPHDRYSLYEMMSIILKKIQDENQSNLSPHNIEVFNFAEDLIYDYFFRELTQSIPLTQILKALPIVFDEFQVDLLGLNCCQAFHEAWLKNPKVRIKGFDNFVVKINGDNLSVKFDETSVTLNPDIVPLNENQSFCDPELISVYTLGKILQSMGIPADFATGFPSTRPTIIELMSEVIKFAKELPDNPYQDQLDSLDEYIGRQQTALGRASVSPYPVDSSDSDFSYDSSDSDFSYDSNDDHITSSLVVSPARENINRDELDEDLAEEVRLDALQLSNRGSSPSLFWQSSHYQPQSANEDCSPAAAAAVFTDDDDRFKPFKYKK